MTALLVYACGCASITSKVPDGVQTYGFSLEQTELGEKYNVIFQLVAEEQGVRTFVEKTRQRPEWLKQPLHTWVPFDPKKLVGAAAEPYEELFEEIEGMMEAKVVPQCWLPDIMRGSGRFFGIWPQQVIDPRRFMGLYAITGGLKDEDPDALESEEHDEECDDIEPDTLEEVLDEILNEEREDCDE